MSRMLIWFYNALLLAFFVGVLAVVNPALIGEPLGFSAIFLSMLAFSFFLDAVAAMAFDRHRFASWFLLSILAIVVFTGIGAPGWGILAAILATVSYLAHFGTRKRASLAAGMRPTPEMAVTAGEK